MYHLQRGTVCIMMALYKIILSLIDMQLKLVCYSYMYYYDCSCETFAILI